MLATPEQRLSNDRHPRCPQKVENQVDGTEAGRLPAGETNRECVRVHPPAAIPDLVGELPAILDGELVMPDRDGRMDSDALAARLAGGQAPGFSPVYLAFDLLWAAGMPILAQPLLRRREHLARIVRPSAELLVLPGVVRDGLDLYFAVAQQGLRGVTARHLRSPYLPGRRSDLWRWIPTRPGEIPLHVVPDPSDAPAPRPVLALIQRLPLED